MEDRINPTYYDDFFDKLLDVKFTPDEQCIYSEFNVYKYLYRYKQKNGIEDLKKCKWYLENLIRLKEQIDK